MRLFRLVLLFSAAVLAAGCERPLVDPLDVTVQVVSPDLERALAVPTLALELRALRGAPGATVRIAGSIASFDAQRGVYQDTLQLTPGLNALPVEILEGDRVAARDTVYALYLDVRAAPATGLPPLPARAGASTSPASDGSTIIAGGVGTNGALATITRLAPSGAATTGALAAARAGHTASRLPSGETLVLGGATSLDPTGGTEFVTTAEIIGLDGVTSRSVQIEKGPFLRAGHTARVLTSTAGRVVVYAYGGRDATGGAVAPTGTVAVLEVTADHRVVRLTPPAGAGNFPAAEFHLQLDLPGALARAVVLDGSPPDGTAFRFTWREPGANYPFDVFTDEAANLFTPRRGAAAVNIGAATDLGGPLYAVAGGRTPGGEVTDAIEIYAPTAGRAFRLPAGTALSVPRERASAAILDGRRIVVFGGVGRGGAPASRTDVFFF